MDIITTSSYEELSKEAATLIVGRLKKKPNLVLGLATGSTPAGMYRCLKENYKTENTDYSQVTAFNLDEYVGLEKNHPNSYYSFMRDNLFQHINIDLKNTYIPDGTSKNINMECKLYEEKLQQKGPIDLQILGLGENGHIGFNEPGTTFSSLTHLVELTASTKKANARFFLDKSQVPSHAITMGIRSIMNAKEIVLLVAGKNKQMAFQQLLYGTVTESFPASILQTHPAVTIIIDNEVLKNSNTIA